MLYGFAFSVRSAIVNLVEVQLAVFLILIFNKALRHTVGSRSGAVFSNVG